MQTTIVPTPNLVTYQDTESLQRQSVMGWLMTSNSRRLLAPAFHVDVEDARPLLGKLLATLVSEQIGGAILGPRNLAIADRLAFVDFIFRDTRRRLPIQTIAVWLSMPVELDWTMRLYYGAWHSYLTSQSLTGWLPWQEQGILPVTALRRMRDRLLRDSVGVMTRLELIEFLKHLDVLAAEW
ncbi:MAG TPA: hypothetical protein VJ793_06940 [Anaerolineae bacterium]|nr:hypothetical protein [Anaerolineae bacterium]